MAIARIIDETGRTGPWTEALTEVLGAAGYGITVPDDEEAGLTVLLSSPPDAESTEERFFGDLLVLSVPPEGGDRPATVSRTEIVGTNRLKAWFTLSDPETADMLTKEIRPLVNLFV